MHMTEATRVPGNLVTRQSLTLIKRLGLWCGSRTGAIKRSDNTQSSGPRLSGRSQQAVLRPCQCRGTCREARSEARLQRSLDARRQLPRVWPSGVSAPLCHRNAFGHLAKVWARQHLPIEVMARTANRSVLRSRGSIHRRHSLVRTIGALLGYRYHAMHVEVGSCPARKP